jgi:hypothetical protein
MAIKMQIWRGWISIHDIYSVGSKKSETFGIGYKLLQL